MAKMRWKMLAFNASFFRHILSQKMGDNIQPRLWHDVSVKLSHPVWSLDLIAYLLTLGFLIGVH